MELSRWVWVLSAETPDEQVHRFLQPHEKPTPLWLLHEILRDDIKSVRHLNRLMVYVWRQVLDRVSVDVSLSTRARNDGSESGVQHTPDGVPASLKLIQTYEPLLLHLLIRLIAQAQRIWPAALVNLSLIIQEYLQLCLKSTRGKAAMLNYENHATHRRWVGIVNRFISVFSIPTSIEPYKSMAYNWSAQRNLLNLASLFDPPLILDQDSYRAVARVLTASQKSEHESKVARLRARTWPPWRFDEDGMDAQRSPDDDLSRVVVALNRAQEAGYTPTTEDQILKILGGLELDGSPTVHTRKILKPIDNSAEEEHPDDDPVIVNNAVPDTNDIVGLKAAVWAARITATRDVQEAWSAFRSFLDRGGIPDLSIYQAMFEKLHFEAKRGFRRHRYSALPGDGREVIAPDDKGYTQSYRLRLQPPHRSDLYDHMIDRGIRPAGECLISLIKDNTRTILHGLHYLYDAGIDASVLTYLSTPGSSIPPNFQELLPPTYYEAFISLLCHFAHRAVPFRPDFDHPQTIIHKVKTYDHFDTYRDWRIFGYHPPSGPKGHNIDDPIKHAAQMIYETRPIYRPIWYELFSTFARPHIIISFPAAHEPWNGVRAWNKFRHALEVFHSIGLELDPRGFDILIQNCQKHILACSLLPERRREYVDETIALARREWAKLSEIVEENRRYNLPRLLHSISPVPVHKYIRLLWRSENAGEIVEVLKWMVEVNEELEFVCAQAANGPSMMRRTLVAVRVFLRGTEWEEKARALVEGVDSWGGWPEDDEERIYLERWCDKLDWVSG